MNLFGQIAVTQAFLPLIRRGGGRLVNVGSIGGRLVLPLHGALQRLEVRFRGRHRCVPTGARQWGYPVSLVDPGGTTTAIFAKTLTAIDDMKAGLHAHGISLYDAQIVAVRALVEKTAR